MIKELFPCRNQCHIFYHLNYYLLFPEKAHGVTKNVNYSLGLLPNTHILHHHVLFAYVWYLSFLNESSSNSYSLDFLQYKRHGSLFWEFFSYLVGTLSEGSAHIKKA